MYDDFLIKPYFILAFSVFTRHLKRDEDNGHPETNHIFKNMLALKLSLLFIKNILYDFL